MIDLCDYLERNHEKETQNLNSFGIIKEQQQQKFFFLNCSLFKNFSKRKIFKMLRLKNKSANKNIDIILKHFLFWKRIIVSDLSHKNLKKISKKLIQIIKRISLNIF